MERSYAEHDGTLAEEQIAWALVPDFPLAYIRMKLYGTTEQHSAHLVLRSPTIKYSSLAIHTSLALPFSCA